MKALPILLLLTFSLLEATPLKEACEALSGTKAYAFETCIVLGEAGPANDWKSHCTHFRNGHLLVIANRQVFDYIHTTLFPSTFIWVGLFQFDKSDEPKGNWGWLLSDGKSVTAPFAFYDPFYFLPVQPSNVGASGGPDVDCIYLNDVNGLMDLECSFVGGVRYACQYEEPIYHAGREYRRALKGYRGSETATIDRLMS